MSVDSEGADRARDLAATLRRAFDDSFAAPARARSDEVERLLLLRIGDDAYALKLSEIAGLTTARKLVPLPSTIGEVLGVVGIRGEIVPVYGLAALLGYESVASAPRWFVLLADADAVALAFDGFEGYIELASSDVHPVTPSGDGPAHVQALARARDRVVSVLAVRSLLETIKRRCAIGVARER